MPTCQHESAGSRLRNRLLGRAQVPREPLARADGLVVLKSENGLHQTKFACASDRRIPVFHTELPIHTALVGFHRIE
jgi:hypothetical protein